jgi:cytochrome c553
VLVNQLVYFRHGERWDIRMEHFADQHHLTDVQAIADVAAYASHLDPAPLPGRGTGELVQRGGRVYFRLCETCHGRSGLGDAEHAVPQIAGQHYEYLRRQIYDAVDGRHPSFPAAHVRLLARLQRDDITGVADYLSRIAPQNARQLATQRSTP